MQQVADELDGKINEIDKRLIKAHGMAMKAEANFQRISKMLWLIKNAEWTQWQLCKFNQLNQEPVAAQSYSSHSHPSALNPQHATEMAVTPAQSKQSDQTHSSEKARRVKRASSDVDGVSESHEETSVALQAKQATFSKKPITPCKHQKWVVFGYI